MLTSNSDQLAHRDLEARVCLKLIKTQRLSDSTLLQRVATLLQEGVELAEGLEHLKAWKQLLYMQTRVQHLLGEGARRNKIALQSLRLGETHKFMREQAHILYSLDDKTQTLEVNAQFGRLLAQVAAH